MLKRCFDLTLACGALLVLAPVMLLAALWIKMDSRGPVLFRQDRVGLNGRLFAILKFRTMVADSEPARPSGITVGADPRITRAGSLLRKYKLDELPQFINVLRGDMSVVGPRPEVPQYVATYPPETRDQVLSVRPGITDLASIAYRNESELLGSAENPEAFYVQEILPKKLDFCLQYVATRSLWLDMTIIWRTVLVILSRR
ncbi:sugar transferase [Variovorax sp. OV329]|uniref:sugar transferase n=1 Tax=Variovorax sp. OV329 TaxID=1882825 RepID=UPI0008E94670|nr:sugar transferase [Variovorax sp. OV329]SFM31680.1 Sugar transferase involved in LPS biosynthesis (colanic, teichoic acid) [Variovorax sp. OV329]